MLAVFAALAAHRVAPRLHALGNLDALLRREHTADLQHGLRHALARLIVLSEPLLAQPFDGIGIDRRLGEQLQLLLAQRAAGLVLRFQVSAGGRNDLLDLGALRVGLPK